ncbi:MAG: SDR family NAD(P)-dependent oxidoreductase, partial [Bacteroidetes bacterium]|nr:SDR family NAD(P)-dependent oxidoreductase [Bacteroidota bacterium]
MKTYIISGAGSGIGKAMAIQLANEGNQIILLGRNKSRLEEVKSALSGENHLVAVADIADKSSVMAAAETIKNMAIDGIIANAG